MYNVNPLLAMISQQNAEAMNTTTANKEPVVTIEVPVPEDPPPKEVVEKDIKPPKHKNNSSERDWDRFSFVCSKDIIQKVHDISEKEGFSIREVMELSLQRGITEYERLHGSAKPKKKGFESILK